MKIFTGSGATGLLLGFLLVWWIAPATGPGAVLVVFVSVLVCFLLGIVGTFVVGLLRRGK